MESGQNKRKFKKIKAEAVIPRKAHSTDSGLDVTILGEAKVYSKSVSLYSTGLQVEPEPGYYLELVARSSLMKSGYMLANSVGIIDNHYRGEIFVGLFKFDPEAADLEFPCRVAQLIPRRLIDVEVREEEELGATARGSGGFGSTGTK